MALVRSFSNPLIQLFDGIKAATSKRVSAFMLPAWAGEANYSDVRYDSLITNVLRKNEVVYRCINATASTASMISIAVHALKDDRAVNDHPLRILLRRPNPFMSETDFLNVTITNLKVAGVAFWEKQRNNVGEVVALWPLRPDWVKVKRGKESLIDHYEYAVPGLDATMIKVEDMVLFMYRDPSDMLKPLSPLEIAMRTAQVDSQTTDFVKSFWQRGGMISGVLQSKQKLTRDQATDLQYQWEARYGGYSNWGKTAVLDSDASYQRIGATFKEMEFGDVDTRNELRICLALDVPPIIAGVKAGLDRSTFSNYSEARRSWWEDTLKPLYKMITDSLNAQLLADFGLDIYLKTDYSAVPALQEDRTERWQRATTAYATGVITRNDARQEMGLPSVPDGDVYVSSLANATIPAAPKPEQVIDPETGKQRKANDPIPPKGNAITFGEFKPYTEDEIDKLFDLYKRIKDGSAKGRLTKDGGPDRNGSELVIDEFNSRVGDLCSQYADGTIGIDDWQIDMRQLIRDAYAGQLIAAAGGDPANVSSADWLNLGAYVRSQDLYLEKFAREMEDGMMTFDQIEARARLYIGSSRAVYWRHVAKGITLPAYPCDGSSDCLGNCGCEWIEKDDGWHWIRGKDDSCKTCIQRAADWSPWAG